MAVDLYIRAVRNLSIASGIFAAALVASAIVVVCQMVAIRYLLNGSAVWQTDYVTFALVGATLIGSPYVLLTRGHVNVDLLPLHLGARGRLLLALLASSGGLLFSSVLAWTGWQLFHEALVGGWRTDTVWELPLWIPYLALPIGAGLLGLQYVADLLALATGRPLPFSEGRVESPSQVPQ